MTVRRLRLRLASAVISALAALAALPAAADISFRDIAGDPAMNLHFERARSAGYAPLLALYEESLARPMSLGEIFTRTAHVPGGLAGVVVFDADGDGDLDLYATNGPGAPNGLFRNRLRETGRLGFRDESESSGAAATDLDTNGACAGDFDNDGDADLYLLGRQAENRLYANDGGGRFAEQAAHGAEGGALSHVSCALGDFDGDGLLDIVVSNTFDLSNALALVQVPYALSHPNQLFRNLGGLRFEDVSESSGIREMALGGTSDPQPPTISWSVAALDLDRDGDMDIAFADDQAALPSAAAGGFDRGYLQVFLNDGHGRFSNLPVREGARSAGAWMALGAGDLDCDGRLDLFASNLGDYMFPALGIPSAAGDNATRPLVGRGDGSFRDESSTVPTVFAWGNAVADFDNDGDPDVVHHGAFDLNAVITHDSPGLVLENLDCSGRFAENLTAFRGDYSTRGTQGVAMGDLDRDGYVDVVSAANHSVPENLPFVLSPAQFGSPLDESARFYLTMIPDPATGLFRWSGVETLPGRLSVEINQGAGNEAVSFAALGSVGLTRGARHNRSGIGAVVSFTPHRGRVATAPIGGSGSFLSQHALEAHFGLGDARSGVAEVQWQGGTRNRLYGVRAGERLVLPEIPCSVDGDQPFVEYARCVSGALADLQRRRVVTRTFAARLKASALIAYFDRE